jgi:DNA-binding NarL/FixJ family response regulator
MIKVVIADDQPMVRAGLATMLGAEADIDVVGTAADGSEAVEAARSARMSSAWTSACRAPTGSPPPHSCAGRA